MPRDPQFFVIDVDYKDDAHEPQRSWVSRNKKIKTAADAVRHILETSHHRDPDTYEIFPAIKAVPVSEKAFTIADFDKVGLRNKDVDTSSPPLRVKDFIQSESKG